LGGNVLLALSPWFAQVLLVLSIVAWGELGLGFVVVAGVGGAVLLLASPAFCLPLVFLFVDRETQSEWRAIVAAVWLGIWALQIALWIVLPVSTLGL